MRFFSALMPRETRFFDLFDRHGALMVEGCAISVLHATFITPAR